ncbi:MAG: hypothetical protein ACYDFT_08640 [Thermoplasmata archaeon]
MAELEREARPDLPHRLEDPFPHVRDEALGTTEGRLQVSEEDADLHGVLGVEDPGVEDETAPLVPGDEDDGTLNFPVS